MHITSRLKVLLLTICVTSAIYGVQVITLENNKDVVFKESGDHILENAMYLYHHYYQRTCDLKLIDFTLAPLYRYNKVCDEPKPTYYEGQPDPSVNNNLIGGYAQAVLNLGDFWVRTDTMFGKFTERFHTTDTNAVKKVDEQSYSGFDDITIRAGYDFFVRGDDHWGPYILGSIPVNHDVDGSFIATTNDTFANLSNGILKAPPKAAEGKTQTINNVSLLSILNPNQGLTLDIKTPQMGVGNYRIGCGLQGACTVYDNGLHHIALFGDLQYSYAMSTSLTMFKQKEITTFLDPNGEDITKQLRTLDKTVRITDPDELVELKYTPGSLINVLGIMHYACGDFNLECGALISGGFGQKLQQLQRKTVIDDSTKEGAYPENKGKPKVEETTKNIDGKNGIYELQVEETAFKINNKPEMVNFKFEPYVAIGYNTLISDNPFTIGVGLAYEYNHTSKELKPNVFQGFTAWTTVSLSF